MGYTQFYSSSDDMDYTASCTISNVMGFGETEKNKVPEEMMKLELREGEAPTKNEKNRTHSIILQKQNKRSMIRYRTLFILCTNMMVFSFLKLCFVW
jgi:hypothetical protein